MPTTSRQITNLVESSTRLMVTFGFQQGTYAEDSSSFCSITDVYLKYKPKKMHSLAYKLLALKLWNMKCICRQMEHPNQPDSASLILNMQEYEVTRALCSPCSPSVEPKRLFLLSILGFWRWTTSAAYPKNWKWDHLCRNFLKFQH